MPAPDPDTSTAPAAASDHPPDTNPSPGTSQFEHPRQSEHPGPDGHSSPWGQDDPDHDPTLRAERAHLEHARADLRRMAEHADTLDLVATDHVSRVHLQATLYWRVKALADDPSIALFFGRVDYEPGQGPWGDRFYIGRRHVNDASGEPQVVDWRADVSVPFYRASTSDPMRLRLRRRFGFEGGELTSYEDEHLTAGERREHSEILEQEIERPRVGPMRDIVATIQPEQDEIVRSDVARTVLVQGAPGTGKTAVGLHRAAYLLYAHRDQLRRQGVLVVGPNDSFLRYIGSVLPTLGEVEARQTTVASLVDSGLRSKTRRSLIRGTDPAETAMLKGDARMAALLQRALWAQISQPTEGLMVPRGARRYRVPTYKAEELLASVLERDVRYAAGRAMLPQRLAHQVLVQMENDGETVDDRTQNAVARSKPVKAYVDALWPAMDATKLVFRLLSDQEFLARHADGLFDEREQELLRWAKPPRSAASARWSLADAVLIDEASDLLERTRSLGHVVLDEAQDLSPMQLRAVGRRCATGSATVLGDLAQATTAWAVSDWSVALGHLGQADAHVEELTIGFRVPSEVIEYAARLLPSIAPSLALPSSIRRSRGELTIDRVDDPVDAAVRVATTALARPGSVGVIVPDAGGYGLERLRAALSDAALDFTVLGEETTAETAEGTGEAVGETGEREEQDEQPPPARLQLVPASLAKGLEYDHVVLVEPAAIVAAEPTRVTGLRRLYVSLTRAVTSLAVLHDAPLPDELSAPIRT